MPRSTGGTASGLLMPKAIASTSADGSRKKTASQMKGSAITRRMVRRSFLEPLPGIRGPAQPHLAAARPGLTRMARDIGRRDQQHAAVGQGHPVERAVALVGDFDDPALLGVVGI